MSEILAAALFTIGVLALVALDLGVFHRRSHRVAFREALLWSAFWITLALTFNFVFYLMRGPEAGLQFLTGYLLEESLSLDNLFLFAVIFSYMAVPAEVQHRVLTWGILGAVVMRGAIIAAGLGLVSRFHWILYVFGAFLIVSGIRFFRQKHESVDPQRNPLVRLARRVFPVTHDYVGGAFFVRREGRTWITPLLLVLLLIETTDVVFALDSIPAVFSVTQDPFIVYASNILALLGLRALFFVLAGAMRRFRYLRAGLAVLLILVGLKMLLARFFSLPTYVPFAAVVLVLAVTIALSLVSKDGSAGKPAPPQR
ncbi:MAG TPA: TerC family protein [Terriglobia bacterium]|nr:TerC family protein [Terriglobia bacterium]